MIQTHQDQQSVLDYYTFCLPEGVILKRGGKKKNNDGVGNEAVFNFNNWLIPVTTETDPSPI